jgi:hypothetical protein
MTRGRTYPQGVTVFRTDFTGNAKGWTRTPQGGIAAPANLTRTGVLTYRRTDGTVFRELRHPEEVFHPDSLATLRAAPITRRHPAGPVTASNWAELAVGHVGEDVRQDGRFVAATVRVQTADVARAIESGDAKEFSCGYHCRLDMTPGEYEGERYDAIQRDIRYNHVGIGPSGWGRAGSEVALRTDGVEGTYPSGDMTLDEALAALTAANKRNDELQARLDVAVARADAAETRAPDEAEIERRVLSREALRADAREILGDNVPKGTDREVKVAAIVKARPAFKADGRSDDYINAAFDAIVEDARKARKGNEGVRQDAASGAVPKPAGEDARQRMIERNRDAWKKDGAK